MATFAKVYRSVSCSTSDTNTRTTTSDSNFPVAAYASIRPAYPESLFTTVLKYHDSDESDSPSGTLLDLGCGQAQVAAELSPAFKQVFAVDPSATMIAQAKLLKTQDNITIQQGLAEDLSFLPNASIDMVVAGEAAHWFDFKRTWLELARVVRPGGALAFWGYTEPVIVGQPAVVSVFQSFRHGPSPVPGTDLESLAKFWEQPGMEILRRLYRDIVPPEQDWADIRRIEYTPNMKTAEIGPVRKGALRIEKRFKLGEVESYFRTVSAVTNWKNKHSKIRSYREGGQGDIIDRLFEKVLAAVPEWASHGNWRDIEVDIVWSTMFIMARRRA